VRARVRDCLLFFVAVIFFPCLAAVVVFVRMLIEQRILGLSEGASEEGHVVSPLRCCFAFVMAAQVKACNWGGQVQFLLFLCACEMLILFCVCLRVSAMTRWRKKNRVECSRTLTLPCLRTQVIYMYVYSTRFS